MNKLRVGFAKTNINPKLGSPIYGYYVPRYGKGFLDDLEVSCMLLECCGNEIAMLSIDLCGVDVEYFKGLCIEIEKETGISGENIFLSATHTHTGAYIVPNDMFEVNEKIAAEYAKFVKERIIDAIKLARMDIKPARMGFIVGYAPDRVAYIRRYKMKDGSTMTCPPINDTNIDYPIGELDQRVNVLRFDREGGASIVLVNYGLHADTINGELFSSDWPGWMRKTISKALDGVEAMFFNGAEGDVGSTNIHPAGGDMNDTEISFDNEMKSPGMARFVGRAIAGTVLQVYDKVEYIDVEKIDIIHKNIPIPANKGTKEQLPTAHKYKELHEAGRDDLIPYSAMELTTVVAEALRICRLEHGSDNFDIKIAGIKLGCVALVGLPGEPFTEIGVKIKETSGWRLIMPCSLTNGDMGYFPVQSAYDEGGYEARTSPYKAGIAERLIDGAKELLSDLNNKQ